MATPMAEDPNLAEDQLASMTTEDVVRASRLLDTEIRILKVLPSLLSFVQFRFSSCEDSVVSI